MTFITAAPQVLPGTIAPYGGASAPSGYLLCDGSAVSRTTYAGLFNVIAELYGVGDGSTTFNVPSLAGKIPVGIGASGITNRGDTGGEQTHTLIVDEIPAHTHNSNIYSSNDGNVGGTQNSVTKNWAATTSTGGGLGHNNMQPYVGTEYIIKT